MKINKKFHGLITSMTIEDICSYYKFIGIKDNRLAYDEYLIETGIRPQVDSVEFQKIYNSSKANGFEEEINFFPNMYDSLRKQKVYAQRDASLRIWRMVWEDGSYGSYPFSNPPDPERFKNLKSYGIPVQHPNR